MDRDRVILLNLFSYSKTEKKFVVAMSSSENERSADYIGRYVSRVKQMSENFPMKEKV